MRRRKIGIKKDKFLESLNGLDSGEQLKCRERSVEKESGGCCGNVEQGHL